MIRRKKTLAICLVVLIGLGTGCTKSGETIRVLEQSGYSNIEITGWRPFAKSEDDFYSTGFRAKAPNGETVTGTVCSGFFKGNTIRLD